MMIKEPRYELRDRETGKKVLLTTDELQVALWLAERELANVRPAVEGLRSEGCSPATL